MPLDLPTWVKVGLVLLAFYGLLLAGGALLHRRGLSRGGPVDEHETPVEDFFGPYTEAMPAVAKEFVRPCPFGLSDADYEDLFDEIEGRYWRTAVRSNEGDRDG